MLYFTISALRAKRVSISIYVSHIHWSHRHTGPIFYNQSTRITLSPMSFLQATDHTALSPFLSPSLLSFLPLSLPFSLSPFLSPSLPPFLPFPLLTLYLRTEEIEPHIPHPIVFKPMMFHITTTGRGSQTYTSTLSSPFFASVTTQHNQRTHSISSHLILFHLISSHLTSSHSTPPHSRLLTHDIHIIKPRAARAVARRSIMLFPYNDIYS